MSAENERDVKRAVSAVERLLKIRLRSEHELRERLLQKGFSAEVVAEIIRRYAKLGLVDDGFFAEQWIKSRQKRLYGAKRIRYELSLKGVDKSIIEEKLSGGWGEAEEQSVVLDLAKRRAQKYPKNLEKDKIRQRLYAYLSRRGFSSTAIFHALKYYDN